jgi:hypothetical protein
MKVMTLFDASGTIHALFQSSTHSEAPVLRFQPAPGQLVEILEVPTEFRHMTIGQIHNALQVDHGRGSLRLVSRSARSSV